MKVPQLSEAEITEHLAKLPGWAHEGDAIRKQFAFKNFTQSLQFVNQVGEMAESINHHPDIDIRYSRVILTLSTHDSGGITDNDVKLAAASDDIADAVNG